MTFQNQLNALENDTAIRNYFKERNLVEFVKTYMQVDTLLNTSENLEPSKIYNELNTIHKTINEITTKISQEITPIKESVNRMNLGLRQQLNECLTNVTHTEIRNMITEIHNSKDLNLKNTLDNFKDKLLNINSQNLNEFDRKSLGIIQNIQTTFNSSLDSHNISHKINSIDTTLNLLHNTFTSNSSKKGEFAETILYNNLIKAFPSSDIINTSQTPNSGDIMIKKEAKPDILIDSKNFQNNVPKLDLEKFYRDCELNNCSGILCNVNNGIANKEHFQVDIQDSRIYIYIANHEFDNTLFQLATKIIYNIHDIIKKNKTNIIEIDKELFERIKIEFNFYLQTFKQHISVIKQNITSLEQLAMNQLEQFFKRTNFNDLKPFSCTSCGAGYGSAKALKKHMSDKHNIKVTAKRGKRTKKTEESEENTNSELEHETEPEPEPLVPNIQHKVTFH